MSEIPYLQWLSANTRTAWWHDSAVPAEIEGSLTNGACGVTTNPVLVAASLSANPDLWRPALEGVGGIADPAARAEEILKRVTQRAAAIVEPAYRKTGGRYGYACAQVNPRFPGDAEFMFDMAKRLHAWAPNIAVKLPVTAAGLNALEECAALGITVTATVSFTLPQVLATAERYRKGLARARSAGVKPGRCFAVVMVGRIDDYLRDVAHDSRAEVAESDIIQCGTAIMKRAYAIFKEKQYEAELMPAGMRGAYHASELAGGEMALSIHPKIQAMIAKLSEPFGERINIPVDADVIKRLMTLKEFVRAYEPDGMKPSEFITYGVVQKTLSSFVDAGWAPIESYRV